MSNLCPKLNAFDKNPDIIYLHNQNELRLSNYGRTIGTRVTVSCVNGRKLVAEKDIVTCLSTKQWDFTVRPTCVDPSTIPGEVGLTDEQTLIVAITAGVGGLIFIILLLLVAAICRMQNKAKKKKNEEMRAQDRMALTSVGPGLDYRAYGLDRPLPYTSTSPPSYHSHDKTLERSQQLSRTPVALPPAPSGHSVYRNPVCNVSSVNDEFHKSRRDDVIDVIARERMMHAVDERDKYERESRVQPNYALFKEDRSRGDNQLPSRGFENEGFTSDERGRNSRPGHSYDVRRVTDEPRYVDSNRAGGRHDDRRKTQDRHGDLFEEGIRHEDLSRSGHQTAKTRAARTHQYVEDHSDMGYSPTIDRRTHNTSGYGGYSPTLGHREYDTGEYGRHAARSSRYEGQNYLTDPTRYNQGRPLDYDDPDVYDRIHWRPDTKPHVYGIRR